MSFIQVHLRLSQFIYLETNLDGTFLHGPGIPRKYEAITGAGIKVVKRVDLPDDFIKDGWPLKRDIWMT